MNIETIIFCNSFGIILMVMLLCSSHIISRLTSIENRLFFTMVLVTMLGGLVEMISFIVDGSMFPGARIINIICNTFIYLANIIYPVIWVMFVDWKVHKDGARLKMVAIWASLPALVLAGALVGNIAGEYFFTISEANVYARGPLCMAVLGFPYIYIAASVVEVYCAKEVHKCLFFPISLFVLPAVIGGVAQAIFFGISVFWASIAIGLTAVYMSKQKEVSYTDPLSKIYNRKYMTYILEKKSMSKTPCAGIMIDVDQFKRINDKFGHLVGDQAIADTGRILTESVPCDAIASRFAGDEFVIIIPTQDITKVLDVIDVINKNVREFNAKGERPYKLSYSIGYSIYVPGCNTIDQFVNEMDQDMYNVKKKKKVYDFHTA